MPNQFICTTYYEFSISSWHPLRDILRWCLLTTSYIFHSVLHNILWHNVFHLLYIPSILCHKRLNVFNIFISQTYRIHNLIRSPRSCPIVKPYIWRANSWFSLYFLVNCISSLQHHFSNLRTTFPLHYSWSKFFYNTYSTYSQSKEIPWF